VIPPPPPLGNRVADLIQVGMELGGRRLFRGLNLSFAAGRRVGITGRNGLGKTTLLRVLLGQVPPTEGTVRIGQLTKFNYVDQGRLQLNPERTLIEEVGDGTEFVIFGEARLSLRAYLKRFLFADDRIVTQVKHLSGGERSRLLLARILKNGGNFLILDEPTNDLDLPTLRVLEEALVAYPGVVVVVSHDRYFLNRVCTDILAFEGDAQVSHHVGSYDDYLEWRRRNARAQTGAVTGAAPKPSPAPREAASARKRKLTFKEQQELAGMEARIEAAESEVARLEALVSDPEFHRLHGPKVPETLEALESARSGAAAQYVRWEELEQIRASA